jgi:hypothetical protein
MLSAADAAKLPDRSILNPAAAAVVPPLPKREYSSL